MHRLNNSQEESLQALLSVGCGSIEVDLLDQEVPEIFAALVVGSEYLGYLENLIFIEIFNNRAKSLI